jgi:hypothetical protein
MTSFTALRDRWQAAYGKKMAFHTAMTRRMGSFQYQWLSRGEKTKWDKLSASESAATDKVFAWLEKNSPWDWSQGVAAYWVLSNVNEPMAMSTEAPELPSESASYGYASRTRRAERRH